MNEIDKVVNIALNEVGYLEKKSNANLYNKTGNAGYNNYTKYHADLKNIHAGIYANGYAWCDTFVDWCFITALGVTRAKELLHDWSAYTPTSASYFKNKSQWYTSNPKKGDIIFFKNSKEICHTGIVYNVDSTYVYTVEGNTSSKSGVVANGGAVEKKSYRLNSSSIAGYGRPTYKKENPIKEENKMSEQIYNWVPACPEWSKPYVQKAWDLGWIKGDSNGNLNLNDSKIFTLVVLLRALKIMN